MTEWHLNINVRRIDREKMSLQNSVDLGCMFFKFLFPGIKAVRLLGTGKTRLGPVDGDTARASPVPGGQGLHGVDGGSSSAAFPLFHVSRAAAASSPQRVARATAVGDSSPANDEVGGGGERWRTRPSDVDEMTKDHLGVLGKN